MNSFGFVGFGLIGGSIARSLKNTYKDCTITVHSRSIAPLEQAKKDGVIDIISEKLDEHFSNCDYIFLCAPVQNNIKYLSLLKSIISDKCIVTDVGSVKATIHKAVTELDMEANFIGGHPMAGSEKTGYANSSIDLLNNAVYIVTPTSKTNSEALEAFVALIKSFGSIPTILDCEQHDIAVAGISHLPHLISAVFTELIRVNDDSDETMHALAATGFKSITRLAASSAEMWSQICETNKDAILKLLYKYIDALKDIGKELENNNTQAVYDLFVNSKAYRDTFNFTK